MERIVKIEIARETYESLSGYNATTYRVKVTRDFLPQYGGGTQVFGGTANTVEDALQLARAMTVPAAGVGMEVKA